MANAHSDLGNLLPGHLEGWRISQQDRSYNPDNLHKLINGGAELYISYGFKNSLNRKYISKDQPAILVDIFDMGTSENAFGVFSHSRETEDGLFGQGSQYVPGLLVFWKDRYFISILSNPETKTSKKAVFRIADHIESAIPSEGSLPDIVNLLPEENLVKESILYFHHSIWLNSYYFIAHENILHINKNTDAVFAKYKIQKHKCIVLIINYPEETDAVHALSSFIKNYLPELSNNDIVKIEDNTWTGCRIIGTHLIAVFNALEKNHVLRLLEACEQKLGGPK
jgi:hypothetical protein